MTLATVFNYFANSLWQVPLLALCCWSSLRLMRATARVQYALWVGTLVLCVALPLRGASVAPLSPVTVTAASAEAPVDFVNPAPAPALPSYAISIRPHTRDVLAGLYLAVCAFFSLRLSLSHLALRRLLRASVAHTPSPAEEALLRSCGNPSATLRVLPSGHRTPMVAGVLRPVLLLPAALLTAERDTLHAVLAHELTHLRRRDTLANLLLRAGSLPIAYHPATAAIHRRIGHARELLCDEAAARALRSPSAYAHVLLTLAQQLIHPGDEAAVGLFPRTSKPLLEERIMHLIAPPAPLRSAPRLLRVAAGFLVLGAAVAAVSCVHLTSSVMAAELPHPTLVTSSQQGTTSAPAETQPLPATAPRAARRAAHQAAAQADLADATAELDKALSRLHDPEFNRQIAEAAQVKIDTAALRAQLEQVRQQLNSPEFRQQIATAAAKAARAVRESEGYRQQMEAVRQQLSSPEFKRQIEAAKAIDVSKLVAESRLAAALGSPAAPKTQDERYADAVEVAPGIMASTVVTRVQPVYPEMAKAAKVEGAVVLKAIIGKGGSVRRLQYLSGPELLKSSAIESVRQWVYKPYLVNGEPVEVETTVTVTYSFGE